MSKEKINTLDSTAEIPEVPVPGTKADILEDVTYENDFAAIDTSRQFPRERANSKPELSKNVEKRGWKEKADRIAVKASVGVIATSVALGAGATGYEKVTIIDNQSAADQLSAEFANTAEDIIDSETVTVEQGSQSMDGIEDTTWRVSDESGTNFEVAVDSEMTEVDVTTPVEGEDSVTTTYTLSRGMEKIPNPEIDDILSTLEDDANVVSVNLDKTVNPDHSLETVEQSYEDLAD